MHRSLALGKDSETWSAVEGRVESAAGVGNAYVAIGRLHYSYPVRGPMIVRRGVLLTMQDPLFLQAHEGAVDDVPRLDSHVVAVGDPLRGLCLIPRSLGALYKVRTASPRLL